MIGLHADGATGPVIRFPRGVRISAAPGAVVVTTGRSTVLLDPATGRRLAGSLVSTTDPWRADHRAGEVTLVDPATSARVGGAVPIAQLAAVVPASGGVAYATASNHDLSVMRLDPEGPRIVWRTPIDPG